ncbi:hypothetical protein M5K25_011301 [Dendrobium thyrsiflorum]|uniref:UDP-glycosyltransferase n=1 Tax=Dendrobium thyrsiflorum TaxID=117978 RepID=A0ABD0V1Y0_DENTH
MRPTVFHLFLNSSHEFSSCTHTPIPFPAQGHIIPLMELSYCLIERGINITFINTEFNHERIIVGVVPDQAKFIDGIHFATIPDGLEPEEDRHKFGRLITSLTKVMPRFLEELMTYNVVKFTCFIADINMAWALSIANNVGLRTAVVWPAAAGALLTILSIPKLIQDEVIDEKGRPMKKEVIQLNPEMTPIDTSNLPWCCPQDEYTQKIMFNYIITNNQATSNAEMIICNSFEMLEKPIFKEMTYILPVGPLHNSFELIRDSNLCHFWSEDKQCIAWLNKHPANSVIYVAFGSIIIFNNKQFQELALGLELIGRPFLWVVRPDLTNKSINCTYPQGFEERVADRGRMIGWSPQQKVLKHSAIACFISHCGWNSTIEGVRSGVPFLCWPYFADQLFNQSYITKVWKVGLSLVPDENELISKEEVGSKVEELLKDRDILARSQALKNFSDISVMEGGSSFKNLNKFPGGAISGSQPYRERGMMIIEPTDSSTVQSMPNSFKRSNAKTTFGMRLTSVIPRYEMQPLRMIPTKRPSELCFQQTYSRTEHLKNTNPTTPNSTQSESR